MGAIATDVAARSVFEWTPTGAPSPKVAHEVPSFTSRSIALGSRGFAVLERAHAALLESIGRPVAVIVDGCVVSLNRACRELFSLRSEPSSGRPVAELWPELLTFLARGEPVELREARIGGRDLAVTILPNDAGPRRDGAIVFFDPPGQLGVRAQRTGAAELPGVFGGMVGMSAGLLAIRRVAVIAASSSSNVVIEGESGSGKEVLSQAIHASGPRCHRPFVAVHCAAIPRELLESELFGYEPGAFTGANRRGNPGKFELAEGGTLLLDDVVDMPLDMQVKLLRVVQERAVTRLGGTRPRRIDVRLIATTNVPLKQAVEAGRFRMDLYYRLNVLRVVIPPLRERREDIPLLAEHFLRKHSHELGRRLATLGPRALRALESYSWPGNVRELEHWIESEIHFAPADATRLEDLSPQFPPDPIGDGGRVRPLRDVEREVYAAAMAAANGDVSRAARELGISRGKLYRKLALYGVASH